MYSRRDFGRTALAAAGVSRAWGKLDSRVNGVLIGVQSYSFRDRALDDAIAAMKQIGFSECELYQGHVEPKMKRDELRHWRLSTPMSTFEEVGRKFHQAGIQLFAYNYSFRDDFTDEEIDRGFQMAKAMGAHAITASSTVSAARRVGPFAEKHRMVVGMHGHSNIKDPNEFARPESFEQAMAFSRYIGVNLDIGHFFAAGYDPVDYIQKHHDKIVCLHIKDRKKDQGLNQPFGEGDTPIKPVLQLLKQNKWKIPANIEYEYKGADTVAEVKRCFEYCKQALG
jgi:sugar phosphate isomerase/epimerase